MKTKTLDEMNRAGLLPQALTAGWEKAHDKSLYTEFKLSLQNQKWAQTILMVICLGLGTYLISLPPRKEMASTAACFFALVVLTNLLSVWIVCRKIPFAKDLEKLPWALNLSLSELFYIASKEELTRLADKALFNEAAHIREAEKMGDPLSPQADEARARFKKVWTCCRSFDLADAKWDRYFDGSSGGTLASKHTPLI